MAMYTTSAKFQFKNGEIVEVPDPGEGWEFVRGDNDMWPHEWCHYVVTPFNKKDGNGSFYVPCSSTSFYRKVTHESGKVILLEYEGRIRLETARVLEWKQWKKEGDLNGN